MNRFSDIHSEPDDRPLRRDAHFRIRTKHDGNREEQLLEGKAISMAPDGSIDCATVAVAHFYHCGHPATDPLGHACAEPNCDNLSCKECSKDARCVTCLKPLCLEHIEFLQTGEQRITLCGRCKSEAIRKQRLQAFARFVLQPFVEITSRKRP